MAADILAAGLEKLGHVSRLVLQPNNREDELRAWLVDHDFRITMKRSWKRMRSSMRSFVVEQGSQELRQGTALWSLFDAGTSSSLLSKGGLRKVEKLTFALKQVPVENQSAEHVRRAHRTHQRGFYVSK